eukprot:scpid73180/ scgid14080/ 
MCCYAVLCSAVIIMLRSAVICCDLPCCNMLCSAVLCYAMRCCYRRMLYILIASILSMSQPSPGDGRTVCFFKCMYMYNFLNGTITHDRDMYGHVLIMLIAPVLGTWLRRNSCLTMLRT